MKSGAHPIKIGALSAEMSFADESILPTNRAFIQQLYNTDMDNISCIDKPIVMAIYRLVFFIDHSLYL